MDACVDLKKPEHLQFIKSDSLPNNASYAQDVLRSGGSVPNMHNYPGFGIDLEYMQHKA